MTYTSPILDLCNKFTDWECCKCHSSGGGPKRQVTRMMPIGVPRVPYRSQKEGSWQWVDIWNCLVTF
jgi:hypothetical protein